MDVLVCFDVWWKVEIGVVDWGGYYWCVLDEEIVGVKSVEEYLFFDLGGVYCVWKN